MKKPTLNIYHDDIDTAKKISFGIEEEGLPYEIIRSDDPGADASKDIRNGGFGVSVAVEKDGIEIYYDGRKEEGPFIRTGRSEAVRAGHNAAGIIKQKPLDI